MSRIVSRVAAWGLGCLIASGAAGDYYAEYDIDGVVGNGPDHISVGASDLVDVDVWVLGGPTINLIGLGITFCNYDGSLELQAVEYYTPESWTNYPPVDEGEGCWSIHAVTLEFNEFLSIPSRVATITWHAAVDQTLDDVAHYDGSWLGTAFNDGNLTEGIGCTIQIGGTSTSPSTWGAVKGLFRLFPARSSETESS